MMRELLFCLTGAAFMLPAAAAAQVPASEQQPNMLLIVADDLGYSDLGAYGGEIRTPSLDALAHEGVQLTNFHSGPTCGPTRAMLMTGIDHHRAGVGTNAAALIRLPRLRGRRGYEGFLNDEVVTFATLLQDAGYHTFMTGKWDLGKQRGQLPTDRGFDRYYGIADGGATHFSDAIGVIRPLADAAYFEDDEPIEQLPDDFYSTITYTDRMLDYIETRPDDDHPWFGYVAYTSPHWPLQVPDDWVDEYRGAYDEGWDAVRRTRLERQIELGIMPRETVLPERNRAVAGWESLSPSQRRLELKRIEIYAAMIELLDSQIGRLVRELVADGSRETVVIFLSDNGSEGNSIDTLADNAYWIPLTFDNRYENLGRRGSYVWLGAGWGQATVTPLRIYKTYTSEGGIRTPAILYSSAGRFDNGTKNALMTVMDIAPTILEIAGVDHPGSHYRGKDVLPLSGRSALGYVLGHSPTVHDDAPIGWELYGNRALAQGDWKALLIWPPEGTGRWQLFNLREDPAESNDLSELAPERLDAMIRQWEAYAEKNGVAVIDEDYGYGRY